MSNIPMAHHVSAFQHWQSCGQFVDWYDHSPFPHIDAFWRLCSRWLFENIVTKRRNCIKTSNFSFSHNVFFPLIVIGYPFNYRDFLFFLQNMFKFICCRIVVWGKDCIPLIHWHRIISCDASVYILIYIYHERPNVLCLWLRIFLTPLLID